MELSYQGDSDRSPSRWAKTHFCGAKLGDVRREQRAIKIGAAMAKDPGKSIPKLFDSWYEVKAAYNFFAHEEATPDQIQAGHRNVVQQQMEEEGTYLLLEDESELSWSGNEPIAGLGPIGSGAEGLQGFQLHSVLAVKWPEAIEQDEGEKRPPVEVLGVLDQQYYVRTPRPKDEGCQDSQQRKKRKRESQLWEQASQRIGPAPQRGEVTWKRVGDREADIYEHLRRCQAYGHGFVIRACQDRVLEDPQTGGHGGRLFAAVREAAVLGQFQLQLRARPGQKARRARLSVASVRVCLRSPQRPGHSPGALPAVACYALRVVEAHPPKGVKPLEWILLCDTEADTYELALESALMYATRWLIEEFHKALKTGCGAERLQLGTGHGLFAAISIMSLVALRLIHLKEVVRIHPQAAAQESGLDSFELQVLQARLARPLGTVRDVALAIGRLGGHLNRKGDGMPGWMTLWQGMSQLRLLVEGARMALDSKRFG